MVLFSQLCASSADLTAVSTRPTRSLPPRRAFGSAPALVPSPLRVFSLLPLSHMLLPCHASALPFPATFSPPAPSYPAMALRGSPYRESLHPSAVRAVRVPCSAIPLLPRSGCVAAARALVRRQLLPHDSVSHCS